MEAPVEGLCIQLLGHPNGNHIVGQGLGPTIHRVQRQPGARGEQISPQHLQREKGIETRRIDISRDVCYKKTAKGQIECYIDSCMGT